MLAWDKIGGRVSSFSWLTNKKGNEVEKDGKLGVA